MALILILHQAREFGLIQLVENTAFDVTDRFSVRNIKANLTYPIGMLSISEASLMTASYAGISGMGYWSSTPAYLANGVMNYAINTSGFATSSVIVPLFGIRPVVTLSPSVLITDGDGGYETPYVIGPLVTRTN